MSLLKNKGHGSPTRYSSGSTLSPTNSLEAIGPLTAPSPQASPQHRNRPLSAPLLDQVSEQYIVVSSITIA